jgi:integrase
MAVQIGAIQHLKRKNQRGKYTARSWVVEDGKKRGVTASGDTREAAGIALRAKLDALEDDARRDSPTDSPVGSLNALWDEYASFVTRRQKTSASTLRYYSEGYDLYFREPWGHRSPASITRKKAFDLIDGCTSPRWAYASLHALMRYALNVGAIERDPTANGFQLSKPRPNPQPLTLEQLAQLEAVFMAEKKHLAEANAPAYADVLVVGFAVLRDTGLRLGELLALTKRDYNPETRTITVRASMTTIYDPHRQGSDRKVTRTVRGTTKTAAALRNIRLPEPGPLGLSSAALLAEKWKAAPSDDSPLLAGRGGSHITPHNFRRRWRDALTRHDATDLAGIHPHQLRHSMASAVVSQLRKTHGKTEAMQRAADMLGHSSTAPLRFYADESDHVADETAIVATLNPAVARWNALVESAQRIARTIHPELRVFPHEGKLVLLAVIENADPVYERALPLVTAAVGPDVPVMTTDDPRVSDSRDWYLAYFEG